MHSPFLNPSTASQHLSARFKHVARPLHRRLEFYRNRNWGLAFQAFEAARQIKKDDRLTQVYLDRCAQHIHKPPSDDWNGVYSLMENKMPRRSWPSSPFAYSLAVPAATMSLFAPNLPGLRFLWMGPSSVNRPPSTKKNQGRIRWSSCNSKRRLQDQKKYLERSRFNVPVIAASVAGCCVGTVCCTGVSDVAEGSEPLGLVGGLSVLAVPFVARQSAQDVFVKLDKDPAQDAAGPASPTVRAAPSAGTNDPSDAAMDAASPTAPDVPQAPETPQLIRLPDGYSY